MLGIRTSQRVVNPEAKSSANIVKLCHKWYFLIRFHLVRTKRSTLSECFLLIEIIDWYLHLFQSAKKYKQNYEIFNFFPQPMCYWDLDISQSFLSTQHVIGLELAVTLAKKQLTLSLYFVIISRLNLGFTKQKHLFLHRKSNLMILGFTFK